MSNERRIITTIEAFDLDGTLLKTKTQGTYGVYEFDNLMVQLLNAKEAHRPQNEIDDIEKRLATEVYDYYEFKEHVLKYHMQDRLIVIHTRGDNIQRPIRLLRCLGVAPEHCLVHGYDLTIPNFLNVYTKEGIEEYITKRKDSNLTAIKQFWGENYFFDFNQCNQNFVRDLRNGILFETFLQQIGIGSKNAHIAGLLVDAKTLCDKYQLAFELVKLTFIDDDRHNRGLFEKNFKDVYETLNLAAYTGNDEFELVVIEAGSEGFMCKLEANNNAVNTTDLLHLLDVKIEELQNENRISTPIPQPKKTKVDSDEGELSQVVEVGVQNQEVKPEL